MYQIRPTRVGLGGDLLPSANAMAAVCFAPTIAHPDRYIHCLEKTPYGPARCLLFGHLRHDRQCFNDSLLILYFRVKNMYLVHGANSGNRQAFN
jgi:hypothetical protein